MEKREALKILIDKSSFDEASKLQVLNLLESMTDDEVDTLGRFFAKYQQEILARKKEAVAQIDAFLAE